MRSLASLLKLWADPFYGRYIAAASSRPCLRLGGWNGLVAESEWGGQGLPHVLNAACVEMWSAAAMAFGVGPLVSMSAIDALTAHGSDALKRAYLGKLVSGEWIATMQLTEPQAGSDVGALRTRGERAADGTYRITGQKIFITYGEHDLTDNIIHFVLARLPDAPPGTRGISLFVVTKFLLNADGTLGARNDLRAHSVEHKLGIHGSPTCTMIFGDHGGATGFIVGEENAGMACMFTMMNRARLGSPRAFIPLISNLVIGVDSTMSVIGLLHLQFLTLWYAPVAFQLLCLPC